jgi:hypothetical protein
MAKSKSGDFALESHQSRSSAASDMDHQLSPPVDLRLRIPLLCLLLVPIAFARLSPFWRVVACIMPLALSGTYRISKVRGEWLETRLSMCFIPVIKHKCKAASVVFIGTKYGGSEPGIWTFVLFGPIQYFFGYLFDFLIPAIGGPYELWLETAKGREFIFWQGFSQDHFEKNLELLRNQTGADIKPL